MVEYQERKRPPLKFGDQTTDTGDGRELADHISWVQKCPASNYSSEG